MKNKSLFTFIVVLFMLSGCLSRPSVIETPAKSVPSLTVAPPTFTVTVTHTPTVPPPTATVTEIFNTATPDLPTANPTQALFLINQLLLQNDYCPSPCIWGIVPGKTTLADAQSIFTHLGTPLEKTNQEGDLEFYYSSFGRTDGLKDGLSFYFLLVVQDGNVTSVEMRISITDNSNDIPVPRELWVAYSPESVLKRYGLPSRVEFSVSQGPSVNGHSDLDWTMYFYYEDLDLIFRYELNVKDELGVGKLVHICPQTVPMESVDIWLGKEPRNAPDIHSHKPLEQLTQMSLDEFYDVVVNGGCFDLIKDNL